MAITKSVEKKAAPGKGLEGSGDPVESLALEYLSIQLHRALVRLGEPARISEIVREVGDESITGALARHIGGGRPRRGGAGGRRGGGAGRGRGGRAPGGTAIQ